jgi:RNA polymerase sigma-70 factor (ECF subfamily)
MDEIRQPIRANTALEHSSGTVSSPTELTPERIFREYLPRIYRLARHFLGNDADAEDVTQEVFVQLMRKLSTFRGEAAFPTWLHHVAVNAALAFRRKRHTREAHRVGDPFEKLLDGDGRSQPVRRWSEQPDKIALDHETHQLIEEAIARMPDEYRDVYVLADLEGLPNADIATMLDLSLPAVKSRLHRARLTMRDALAPHFEEACP